MDIRSREFIKGQESLIKQAVGLARKEQTEGSLKQIAGIKARFFSNLPQSDNNIELPPLEKEERRVQIIKWQNAMQPYGLE